MREFDSVLALHMEFHGGKDTQYTPQVVGPDALHPVMQYSFTFSFHRPNPVRLIGLYISTPRRLWHSKYELTTQNVIMCKLALLIMSVIG